MFTKKLYLAELHNHTHLLNITGRMSYMPPTMVLLYNASNLGGYLKKKVVFKSKVDSCIQKVSRIMMDLSRQKEQLIKHYVSLKNVSLFKRLLHSLKHLRKSY